jgi:hypothetical protein
MSARFTFTAYLWQCFLYKIPILSIKTKAISQKMVLTRSLASNENANTLRWTVDMVSSYHLPEIHTKVRKKDIKKELKNNIK